MRAENDDIWSIPVSSETIENAKKEFLVLD
ncbi:hypothetical protein N3C_0760 [Clostridium sp. N3C]|nr:hypothetical protein N3C_0760 [Clostridium sp. N3C]